jgi:cell division protein FtsL
LRVVPPLGSLVFFICFVVTLSFFALSRNETLLWCSVVILAMMNAGTFLFFYLKIKLDVDNRIYELEEKLNEVLEGKN